jgi:ferredoxin
MRWRMALDRMASYNAPGLLNGGAAFSLQSPPCKGPSSMPKVTFVKEKTEIEVPVGSNLRQEARKAGIEVYRGLERYLNCRGLGLCGTCKVLVKKGMENLNKKTLMERINMNAHPMTMLALLGNEDEMRLACQVQVNGDCTIETTPAFNWSGENFWQKPYPNK